MKRLAILLAVLAAVALVGCRDTKEDDREQVREVLEQYTQAVHEEVVPKITELSKEEITGICLRVAKEKLLPHKELLMADVESRLAKLSSFRIDNRDDWENIIDPVEEFDEIFREWSSDVAELSEDEMGISLPDRLFVKFWDPFFVSARAIAHVRVGTSTSDDLGKRSHLFAFSGWGARGRVLSRDPAHPVVVTQLGPELSIVHLRRTEGGYYKPVRVELLRRKGTSPTTQEAE